MKKNYTPHLDLRMPGHDAYLFNSRKITILFKKTLKAGTLNRCFRACLLLLFLSFTTLIFAQAPTITSFSPATGAPGASITITGTNFNTTASSNIVYFGASKGIVTSASVTQLVVTVPSGATCKPITELNTTTGLSASSNKQFVVTIPPYLGKDFTSASFKTYVIYPNAAVFRGISIADIDGDGKPDLVMASNSPSTSLYVVRNTSTPSANSFDAKVGLALAASSRFVFTADLDNDGKIDLVAVNTAGNFISIFRNTSTSGSISFGSRIDVTANNPLALAISDLDGDGKPEIVASNSTGNIISVFKNSTTPGTITSGSFTKTNFTSNAASYGVAIGDLDGDGKPDIVAADNSGSNVSVFRNTITNGTIDAASFAAKVDFATGVSDVSYSVSLGDLDGDGKLDIVIPKSSASSVGVFRNTSTPGSIAPGSFASIVDLALPSGAFYADLADLDGDGKIDILAVSGSNACVFRNKSTSGSLTTGSFQARQDYAAAATSSPNCVAVADINGDGKADIIPTIPSSTDSYSLLINDAINASPTIPVDNNAAANSVAENSPNGTTVGVTGFSTDPEGSTVSYALSDDAGGRFTINSSTGVVTVADATLLDYETNTSHSITIQASDGNSSSTQNFTIAVTDVVEVSSNANLSSLSLSTGTLSPSFASGTTSYTATVSNATTSITVTPTVADATATVTVNGVSVTSGNASGAIAMNVGPNTVTTVVTAQDGTTIKTYTVTVTRAASTDADLSDLVLSAGTLSPAFAAGTTSYTASVSNATTSITVTPTVDDANATVTVNGVMVTSGNASGAIALNVGSNSVTTVVTAQDGTTTNTYTVTITRAASADADLSDLTISAGTLSPAFAAGTTSYTASVSNATTSITVTPTVDDANATVTVNGVMVTSGNASGAIALNVGSNTITTIVTAPDGTTTQTYTVTASRASVLPLTLVDFTATNNGSDVELSWVTSSEINVAKFEVEASNDGSDFNKLAEVSAQGNSTSVQHYSFTNFHPGAGDHYYRLRMIDKDADYVYSKIVRIVIIDQLPSITILSNPVAGGQLNLGLINLKAGKYDLALIDMKGVVVYKQSLQNQGGLTTLKVQLPLLARGEYTIQLRNNIDVFTLRAIMQ